MKMARSSPTSWAAVAGWRKRRWTSPTGKVVADHLRSWARHQTFTDPGHASAAAALRRSRFGLASTPAVDRGTVVQVRDLYAYDTAFGLNEGAAS